MTRPPPIIQLSIALGAVLSLLLLSLIVWLGWLAGGQVEARLFPVLETSHVAESIHLVDKNLCWSTHFVKLRWGEPAYVLYLMERKIRVRGLDGQIHEIIESTPVLTFRYDQFGQRRYLSRKGFTDDIHKPGQSWTEEYCMDAPMDLKGAEPFTMTGTTEYDMPHGLWRVPAKMPSFRVESMDSIK